MIKIKKLVSVCRVMKRKKSLLQCHQKKIFSKFWNVGAFTFRFLDIVLQLGKRLSNNNRLDLKRGGGAGKKEEKDKKNKPAKFSIFGCSSG